LSPIGDKPNKAITMPTSKRVKKSHFNVNVTLFDSPQKDHIDQKAPIYEQKAPM
jgi:hypothetical protein